MEFQTLILQIAELEEVNRQDKAKLLAETALHASTKKELDRAQNEVTTAKGEIQKMTEKIVTLETTQVSHEKIIAQLKQAVKDSKEENRMLKETTQQEVLATKQARETFVSTIDKVNTELRNCLKRFSETSVAELEAENATLKQRLLQYKANSEQDSLINAVTGDKEPQSSSVEKMETEYCISEQSDANKEAELLREIELLEGREKELKSMMEKREKEINAIAEEFQELDNYSKLLEQHLQQAEVELNQRSTCPNCGAALVSEMVDQATK